MTLARLREKCVLGGLSEVTGVDAKHAIEKDGEIAHANLRFALDLARLPREDEDGIEFAKTEICASVWHALKGPLRHICPDDDEADHPSVKLPCGPLGDYSDGRTFLRRLGMYLNCLLWRGILRLRGLCAGRNLIG